MEEEPAKDNSRSKRRKRSKGSQTSENNGPTECSCHDCASMANLIASMENKLDKALQCIEEIECLKKKQMDLKNKNRELEESLEFPHANYNSEEETSRTEQGYRGVGRRCETIMKAS